ncbi:MAG: PLP-dependent cysteine synthase family protein [Parcubacteria group bacterium]|nr:PLP-dependent cysteine synthase family protein [Parcubacteria group bacterium]
MIYQNILQAIGNTPLVGLDKLIANPRVNLFAKLEGQNPGGSIKDRAALHMVERAEKRGELDKSKTILEATSGNMGIALAMIGAQRGYSVQIAMSEGMSEERKRMIKSYGAQLVLTDKRLGTEGAITRARELVEKHPERYWFVDQFNNPDNVKSHYHGIAKEIIQELKSIDVLVAGMGTSGTIMGIAKRFREESPGTKIVGVIPPAGYTIQGIQNPNEDYAGNIYKAGLIDENLLVQTADAFKMVKKVARAEGLFLGMSSGAALFAALQKSKKMKEGNIVVILPDRGEKYLSTKLFSG